MHEIVEEAAGQSESAGEIPLDRSEAFHAAVDGLPEEHREVFK
jgi:hypothetical protein